MYIPVMRRYQSVQQAAAVLTLLGYEQSYDNTQRVIPGQWESANHKPRRVSVEVRAPYPHRVIVRPAA